MAILVTCADCGQSTRVKDQMAGRSIRCRGCGEYVEVPDAGDDDFIQTGDYAISAPVRRPRDEYREDWRDEEDARSSRRRRKRSDDFQFLGRLFAVAVFVAGVIMIPLVRGMIRKGEIPFFGNQPPAPADQQADRQNAPPWPGAKPAPGSPSEAGHSTAQSPTNIPANPPTNPPARPSNPPPAATSATGPGNSTPADRTARRRVRTATRIPVRTGTKTDAIGGPGGFAFEGLAPNGRLLGLRYAVGSWAGEAAIGQLEPVFEQSIPNNRLTAVVAREGYAVGALEVDSDKLVNALRIVFMSIDEQGKLDPSRSYKSDWLGTRTRRATQTIDGKGATVIGIHGRRGAVLDAIGLVLE